jgi:hypothetical protein
MRTALFSILFLVPAVAGAQSVDILYAGNTYTPPFYQGGALWSGESTLKMLAVPQGLGDPKALNYRWSRGTTVLGSLSGVGKSSLSYTDDLFSKPQVFLVEIVDANDDVLAKSWISLAPTSPSLLVYEKHPLYGFLFNQEAGANYRLTEAETTFGAFPLFFTTLSRANPALAYAWRSKGAQDSAESLVTYRVPAEGRGQASISLKASNPNSIRQMAERSFLVQFGNEN